MSVAEKRICGRRAVTFGGVNVIFGKADEEHVKFDGNYVKFGMRAAVGMEISVRLSASFKPEN